MTSLMLGVAVLVVGTYLIRLAGPMLRSRVEVGPAGTKAMERAGVVLLVAVAVTGAFFVGADLAGWARPAGVAAGIAAALLRAPLVVIVVVAVATTAGLRAAGIA